MLFVPLPACVCERALFSLFTLSERHRQGGHGIHNAVHLEGDPTNTLKKEEKKKREDSCDTARQPGCK